MPMTLPSMLPIFRLGSLRKHSAPAPSAAAPPHPSGKETHSGRTEPEAPPRTPPAEDHQSPAHSQTCARSSPETTGAGDGSLESLDSSPRLLMIASIPFEEPPNPFRETTSHQAIPVPIPSSTRFHPIHPELDTQSQTCHHIGPACGTACAHFSGPVSGKTGSVPRKMR